MTTVPFTILVDKAEQHPFSFQGIKGDADVDGAVLHIPTREESLGVHSTDPDTGERSYEPRGDYSIEGMKDLVTIERKSVKDCSATLLGWEGRRERFAEQLMVMECFWRAAVVVEGTFGQVLREIDQYGIKSAELNRKIVGRTYHSWAMRHSVQWFFYDDRRMAEVYTFRILQKAHKEYQEWQKREAKIRRQAMHKELF